MNEIVSKLFLAGDEFMSERYLRQTKFTYSAYRSFTKSKESIQKFIKSGESRYIYQNELN